MIVAALMGAALPQENGWSIDRGPEKCVASRVVRAGDAAVRVEVRSSISSDYGATIAFFPPETRLPQPIVEKPGMPPPPVFVTLASPRASGLIFYRGGVPSVVMALSIAQTAQLAGASHFRLDITGGQSLDLDVAGSPPPMAALRKCGDDIYRSWGADPAAIISAGTPQRTAGWFRSDDYPKDALRAGIEGRIIFLVSVDRAGAPLSCKVVVSTGNDSLDSRTCELALTRGSYVAVGKDAPAVRWATGVVNWRL